MRGRVSHTALASRRAFAPCHQVDMWPCAAHPPCRSDRARSRRFRPQATLRRFAGANNMPPAHRPSASRRQTSFCTTRCRGMCHAHGMLRDGRGGAHHVKPLVGSTGNCAYRLARNASPPGSQISRSVNSLWVSSGVFCCCGQSTIRISSYRGGMGTCSTRSSDCSWHCGQVNRGTWSDFSNSAASNKTCGE